MPTDRFKRYLGRAQRFGARTVLFQHAAAARLGLTPTELETLRLVQHEGPVTAAELAKQTGLTAPSMSAIVDKLAKGRFLNRRQDSEDRRRWILEAEPKAIAKIDKLYSSHAARVERLLSRYSDDQFDIVIEFMTTLADELKDTAIEFGKRT